MNNIYQSPIHGKFSGIKGVLYDIIEKVYVSPDQDKGTMEQARLIDSKKEACEIIPDFCSAIEQKMEALNYKLQLIKTFDWVKLYNFEKFKSESNDHSVEQVLQDGKLKVKFLYKETMLNFIYTEASTFVSIINSIIDNIAEILYYTFNLDFNYIRTIQNVAIRLKDGNLKNFIQQRFCDDLGFCGMRDIRKVFEHKNHKAAIQVVSITNLFGEDEVIIARVNVKLIKAGLPPELDLPGGDKIDNYCDFLYKKTTEVLSDFIAEVSRN